MATKTVYVCDNIACLREATQPEKWFSITTSQNIITIAQFQPQFEAKAFCGITCAQNFISTQLPKLHKADVEQPKEALSVVSNEEKKKNLEEFIYGPVKKY